MAEAGLPQSGRGFVDQLPWISPALPGRAYDLGAARIRGSRRRVPLAPYRSSQPTVSVDSPKPFLTSPAVNPNDVEGAADLAFRP